MNIKLDKTDEKLLRELKTSIEKLTAEVKVLNKKK
tara:strand:+ start:401 stop:505 length:105 start_codon:yes stop_codon:yes gene_type:complete